MEENYFLLTVVMLIIFIASLISYYDSNSASNYIMTGEFCTDFSAAFPGCGCSAEDSKIYEFKVNISNALVATHTIENYYISLNQSCTNPECFELGNGFYNCFCKDFAGTLRSNGEYYRTECGV